MASPTLYFPFLPFLETQNHEHVVILRKLKGMAESLRVELPVAVSKAQCSKPSRALC